MNALGPVSAVLEAEVRQEVRRHGVVVWLDRDSAFCEFVDRLAALSKAGELPYQVAGFRGSFLELMLAVGPLLDSPDRPYLLVHMPGFNEDSVRQTPVYELYAAGKRFRKALSTLIAEAAAGRVLAADIAAFQNTSPTLEQADAWLTSMLHAPAGGLARQIHGMPLCALMDDLLEHGEVSRGLDTHADMDALWQRLAMLTGMDAGWRQVWQEPHGTTWQPRDVAFVTASFALCVEYVHDLGRAPRQAEILALRIVPAPLVEACRELAAHLRARDDRFYEDTAGETESWLMDEVQGATAEDLGRIDTFRFEEETIFEAALHALQQQRWDAAATWARERQDGKSFWLRDPARQNAWSLVQAGARLGQAVSGAGAAGSLGRMERIEQVVNRYVEVGAAVDRAHRELEQMRARLLHPQLVAGFDELRARLDDLRVLWHGFADDWSRAFAGVCRRAGFVPEAGLQQRTVFDQVVAPMVREAGRDCVAYFVIDALRYEMAQELQQSIEAVAGGAGAIIHLRPRLAELPTITDVGMNALAPVALDGRLRPVLTRKGIRGFHTRGDQEFQVTTPETRKRAMQHRVGGDACPWKKLDDVVTSDAARLRLSVARARLLIVHSTEIDEAGEAGLGPAVFDVLLQKLRAAWQLLREAGVQRFIITADHGFLLLNEATARTQAHGRKIDPKRRHVLSPVAADHRGEVRVALAELGYQVAEEQYLMMPESTAVFDKGGQIPSFVHGGNSLQERVIPVLTIEHRAPAGSDGLRYAVRAKQDQEVAGMYCIAAQVDTASQRALSFAGRKHVELALHVVDGEGATVEMCQTRGAAKLIGATIRAEVGQKFELFFRITGPRQARVQVRLGAPSAAGDIEAAIIEKRFAVMVTSAGTRELAGSEVAGADMAWLDDLPEGVRQIFAHLAAHGSVTADEATGMLGSPRAFRRFSARFEEHAARAPFNVRIEVVGGIKRYVREGDNR